MHDLDDLKNEIQDLEDVVVLAECMHRLSNFHEFREVINVNLLEVRRNALVSQLYKFTPQSPEYQEMVRELDHLSYLSQYFLNLVQRGVEAKATLRDAQLYLNEE